jgi:hypothetical protein
MEQVTQANAADAQDLASQAESLRAIVQTLLALIGVRVPRQPAIKLPQLPENLAQHSHHHRRVAAGHV